ncbi:hypothetical protein CXB51_028671 [Gossypium anomalum]|uniref:Retrotransposon gag domain-containing protein n=1 Tax=Gossypium anomalum TaxID=47600 RepID=A0A8J5XYF4_9ROSI|nr:hypothetical protein CXB51_028671 [Gossypium anomalum]
MSAPLSFEQWLVYNGQSMPICKDDDVQEVHHLAFLLKLYLNGFAYGDLRTLVHSRSQAPLRFMGASLDWVVQGSMVSILWGGSPSWNNYFKAEGVADSAKVWIVMLHLEGKTLDWHYFYLQRHGGFHLLTWDSYAHSLKERFGLSSFKDHMEKLVSLKQVGPVDQFYDYFVSLFNQPS